MQIIPLQATPSQVETVNLANQSCILKVYQKQTGLYLDLLVNDALVLTGALCLNKTRVKRSIYIAFNGDLFFIDNQGNLDPFYTGLGDNTARFSLAYITAAEAALLPQ